MTNSRPRQSRGTDLPLKRIALLSSGVGYFEHSGNISAAAAEILLPFDSGAVNDALKSLDKRSGLLIAFGALRLGEHPAAYIEEP